MNEGRGAAWFCFFRFSLRLLCRLFCPQDTVGTSINDLEMCRRKEIGSWGSLSVIIRAVSDLFVVTANCKQLYYALDRSRSQLPLSIKYSIGKLDDEGRLLGTLITVFLENIVEKVLFRRKIFCLIIYNVSKILCHLCHLRVNILISLCTQNVLLYVYTFGPSQVSPLFLEMRRNFINKCSVHFHEVHVYNI